MRELDITYLAEDGAIETLLRGAIYHVRDQGEGVWLTEKGTHIAAIIPPDAVTQARKIMEATEGQP